VDGPSGASRTSRNRHFALGGHRRRAPPNLGVRQPATRHHQGRCPAVVLTQPERSVPSLQVSHPWPLVQNDFADHQESPPATNLDDVYVAI